MTALIYRDGVVDEVETRTQILRELSADRVRAHRVLFSGRHDVASSPAHDLVIEDMHSTHPRIIEEAFRGFAKSTIAEETMILRGGLGEFKYGIILGNTVTRAAQRLASIKREIDQNRALNFAFGDLKGSLWNVDKISLANGTIIEVFGARQSLRGAKEVVRPDFVLIDDLEDEEWVKSEEAVRANMRWFMAEFLPALQDPLRTPIRMLGTPLADKCLLRQLVASGGWQHRRIPIKHRDDAGEWTPTWTKYPLVDIDRMEQSATSVGQHRAFMQEYMLETESVVEQTFAPSTFVYEPSRVRTWQATFAMIDPARTTNAGSATTGWAVWSWSPGGKLVVWECDAGFLQPNEIIDLIFRLNDTYQPVLVGFEEDGLNQWATQPIREAQTRRGTIPLRPMKAPKGKLDFIKGLQTYAEGRNLIFAGEPGAFATATAQFLTFPRGRIDAPNALAFAQLLRPGEPVYGEFSVESIFEGEAEIPRSATPWLALNADGARVTGVLCMEVEGAMLILADWCRDGPPAEVTTGIMREASRMAGGSLRISAPQVHFDRYRNLGLAQVVTQAGARATPGTSIEVGRTEIKKQLQRRLRGAPALQVSSTARRVLNGMSAGYAFAVLPGNVLAVEPTPGLYRTLLEGLEAFAGTTTYLTEREDDSQFRVSRNGRRYRSALA